MINLKAQKIEWIGEIPINWELRKIKYIFKERKEMNNPIKSKNLISLTIDKGVIPHSEKEGGGNKPKEDISKYKLVYPGDIVLNSMNVIAGAVGLSKYFGVVSPVYYMLTPIDSHSNNEYFKYLFRTEIFQKSLYGLGNGILIKENEDTGKLNTIRMRISMDKLGNQFIPLPPNQEQNLISHYLNKKTEKIDSLIEKIEKKIELLKEQKTALINQYVTKGIDSNVDMRDSGVEWIGEIPKHWKLSKLKYELEIHNNKRIPLSSEVRGTRQGPFPYYGSTSLIDWVDDYLFDGRYILVAEDGANLVFRNLRLSFIVEGKFWVNNHAHIMKSKNYIYDEFYCELLEQTDFSTYITGSAQPKLTLESIKEIPVYVPPENEVVQIINLIVLVNQKYSKLMISFSRKLDLLKEYRQLLISSVVTGKVRITEDMI